MFDEIFESRVRDLWSHYRSTDELKHRGEQGLLRELFLRRLLESLLPSQFGIGSGIIVDKWNRQSPQADLVIFDRRLIPPLLHEGGSGIYLMDSVLRVIEVKSTLRKRDLQQFSTMVNALSPTNDSGLKLANAGQLENGNSYYPFATLFAYRSPMRDVDAAKSGMSELLNRVAPIFVVSTKVGAGKCEIDLKQVRLFCNAVLDQLEETAKSRGSFSLREWMH